MTTIAYRDGILASDSMISYSTFSNGCRNKIVETERFSYGFAGFSWIGKALKEWVSAGCPEAAVPAVLLDNEDKFDALIVDNETGIAYSFDNGFLLPVDADYTAVGSGAMLAIGAMAHGASAVEAVLAASLHDKNTGGPVNIRNFQMAA